MLREDGFAQIIDGKEHRGGDEHAYKHGAGGCGSDKYAVEKEGCKPADGYDECPEEVLLGSVDDVGFVAEET